MSVLAASVALNGLNVSKVLPPATRSVDESPSDASAADAPGVMANIMVAAAMAAPILVNGLCLMRCPFLDN